MNRFATFARSLVVLIVLALTVDYWNVTRKEKLLSIAVSQIGGRAGSIPLWPLGTEYRITLTAVPNPDQLNKLAIANQMRGSVGIAFEDCDLTQDDIHRMRARLPKCILFVVQDGKSMPMTNLNYETE